MSLLQLPLVRSIGVHLGLWNVVGSPAPTLIVASERRLADPLPVLETAVASLGQIVKAALIQPSPHAHLADGEYVFAQVIRGSRGEALDLSPECGHSMLAAAAHMANSVAGDIPHIVRLVTYRSGTARTTVCEVRPDPSAPGSYRCGLEFPIPNLAEVFPLGTPSIKVPAAGVELPVTVVSAGNPYAFVDATAAGLRTPGQIFGAGEELRELLAHVRAQVAPMLGLAASAVLPKPAMLLRRPNGGLFVRALSADGWHPGLALTGLVAIAALVSAEGRTAGELAIVHASGTARATVRRHGTGATVMVAGRKVALVPLSRAGVPA